MQKARGSTVLRHGGSTACRWTGSGTLSLPSQGFFSPFPHGTGSLSVAEECLALGDGPPGFAQGFSCLVVLGNGTKRETRLCPSGLSPSSVALSSYLRLGSILVTRRLAPCSAPHPPENRSPRGLGCSAFARRY